MPSNQNPPNRQVPLLQFIIALLLVKSKPSTLSCTEFRKHIASYIRREAGPRSSVQTDTHVDADEDVDTFEEIATLRDPNAAELRRHMAPHTKKGPHPEHSSQADAHIDVAAFWRKKADRLEEEKATLKEQNTALEDQVSQLQERVLKLQREELVRVQDSAGSDQSAHSQTLKRRRGRALGEDVRGPSTKRPKTMVGEQDAVLPDPTCDETGFKWDELGDNLLDSLHKLQGSSIAREANLLGPTDLASKLSNAATGICRHLSQIDLPTNRPDITNPKLLAITPRSKQVAATYSPTKPEDLVEQRLLIIGQTLPHFLVHLHTLSQVSGTENLCEKVSCKYINIFRVLFQRVCDLAVSNVKSDQHRQTTRKELDAGRKRQSAMSSSDERPAIPPITMGLCKLAVSMLCCLDPTKSTHRKVLEDCLNLLVTRVGKVLESFTIGGRPYGIEWDAKSMANAASDAEAFEAQAPYLIWMLECTQRFNLSASLATNAMDARLRLQNTLLKALYGEQASDSFEPGLKPPEFPPDDEIMTNIDGHIGSADIRDWFKSEVWRLVGWDVLREKAWGPVGRD